MQFCLLDEGQLKALEMPAGFHLGLGVFETLRIQQCPTGQQTGRYGVLGLDRHLQRLSQGCEFFNLHFAGKQNLLRALSQAFNLIHAQKHAQDYLIRIVSYREHSFLTTQVWHAIWQFEQPIKLKSVIAERPFPETKNCSAIVSQHARDIALRNNYHEALLLNHQGLVREAAWSNIFWTDSDGKLNTTRTGVLPGITRELILNLFPEVVEKDLSLKELLEEAQEFFVCQATHGVIPVSAIDQTPLKVQDFRQSRNVLAHYQTLFETHEFISLD